MIKKAAEELNNKICDPRMNDFKEPRLPVIHKIGCLERKGCRSFYVFHRYMEQNLADQ